MNKRSSADNKINRPRRPIGNHVRRRAISGITAVAITLALVPGFSQANTTATFTLESTIAFVSGRDNPNVVPLINAAEIYLMNPDGTDVRRLTENVTGDGFPALSPDGKKIVFDSNRNIAPGEPLNTTELFVMKADGSEQMPLLRGGSASWSPDGRSIVFHRSASGTGLPERPDPGAATVDSDIFVMSVDDFLKGVEQPRNITNNPAAVDDDPDWSSLGQIVFTSHAVGDHLIPNSAELYVINPDRTGLQRLTFNTEEERSPDWSPDGTRLAFSCRIGGGTADLEICVMDAEPGAVITQLTDNLVNDLSPSWSPDGETIAFQRPMAGRQQIWLMNADGTGQVLLTDVTLGNALSPNWGKLRVKLDA